MSSFDPLSSFEKAFRIDLEKPLLSFDRKGFFKGRVWSYFQT